jgi:hypothetical protein
MEAREGLQARLAALRGVRCWCAAVLGPNGFLHLALGGKVPRRDALPGEAVPDDLRRFAGELGLFVECPWRLQLRAQALASSHDAMFQEARALGGLARLAGTTVRSARAAPPGDVRLSFTNGLILSVFADRTDPGAGRDNWSLVVPQGTWTVGAGGEVRAELEPELRVVRGLRGRTGGARNPA